MSRADAPDTSNSADGYAIGGGAIAAGAGVAGASKGALTGRTTLYHGTRPDLHKEILEEGLRPAAAKQKGITEILGDAVPTAKDLVYTTPKKTDARQYYIQANHLKTLFDENPNPSQGDVAQHIGKLRSDPMIAQKVMNPLDNKGILEANVPLWKKEYAGKLTPNPEGGRNLDEYIRGKGLGGVLQPKVIHKLERDSLMQARVFKDGLGPEVFVKSPKYNPLTAGEVLEYAKTKPGRFAVGAAGALSAVGLGVFGANKIRQTYNRAHTAEETDTPMKTAALLDELAKLGAVSDAQAQAALEKYEALEASKPSVGQVARYGALGAIATPAIGALTDRITGGKTTSLRGHIGRAVGGALTSGALPLVRSHMDRQVEMGTLKKYIRERRAPEGSPAGKLSAPFEPVEKAAAVGYLRRALRAANGLLDDVDGRVVQQLQQEGLKTTLEHGKEPALEQGKEKDSGMTGATPARSFDAGAYDVGLMKGAFARSQYAASLPGWQAPQKSYQPGFRAPDLRTVGQADPQQIKTGGESVLDVFTRVFDHYARGGTRFEKAAAGAPTRGGFLLSSEMPAFRGGTLKSPIQTPPQQIVTKFASIPTTPLGRLAKAKSIGLPKVTAPPGPSIQQIAKPHGFGRPIAGATKTPG